MTATAETIQNLQSAIAAESLEVSGRISLEPFYDTTDTIYLTADTCYLEDAVTYRFMADAFYTSDPCKCFLLDLAVTADSLRACQNLVAEKLGSKVRIVKFWISQDCPF
jgi:hypothetical protein